MRRQLPAHSGLTSWLPLRGMAIMPPPDLRALLRISSRPMKHPSADPRPIYTIDALDRIVFANSAWVEFMRGEPRTRKAAADELTIRSVIGRPVWDFIEGVQVRQLWEVLYERVRAVGAPVFVPMRCDTPSLRRLIDLELHPLGERSIQHVCECVWSEARPAVALLDPAYPRNDARLLSCAWCSRIRVRVGAWEEIEDAQLALRIEATETLPALQQGVCTTCKQSLLKTFPARVA
jgi:hypothetical protein